MKVNSKELNMMIVSDVHVMAPELLINEGAAFDEYLHNDRKMLKESPAILQRVTDDILKAKPDIVLMPGDLTKDGEVLSHQFLKDNCLDILKEQGIKVFVIPGNHDINNPDGVSYDGDKLERVETLQQDNFAEFYADYGYDSAFDRDTVSLSYVTNLTDSIILLGLDANMYEHNDFEKGYSHYQGRLKDETIKFAEKHIKAAKKSNKRIIAFMHHGLVKHWKLQDIMMPGYLINDSKKVARKFEKLGLEVIFTGHSHCQDISKQGKLYDVQTGSIVSFPMAYRIVKLNESKMDISTVIIDSIDYDFNGISLFDHAQHITQVGIATIIAPFFPEKIPAKIRERATEAISRYVSINYLGDEVLTIENKAEIKSIVKQIRPYSLKWSIIYNHCSKALLDGSKSCSDNELTIEFKH